MLGLRRLAAAFLLAALVAGCGDDDSNSDGGGSDGGGSDATDSAPDARRMLDVTIDAVPPSGAAPLAVTFTATVTGSTGGDSYLWSFGDNAADTTAMPTHTYDADGVYTVSVTVIDSSGAVGTGTTTVTVTPIPNQPPVNTVPSAQTTAEDTAIVFFAGGANAITVADPDVGSLQIQVQLSVVAGTLTLSRTTGLFFLVGDGNADASMEFRGPLGAVNAALEGLRYVPGLNFNGSDTLSITTNDRGNTGAGGPQTDTDTVALTITAVNDAPVITAIADQSAPEDTVLGPLGFTISDAETPAMSLTVNATSDTPLLIPSANLVLAGTGGARSITVTPAGDRTGMALVTVSVSDGVNTTIEAFAVTITDVNDPPTLAAISDVTVNEDATAQTVSLTGIGAGGVGEDSQTVTVTATTSAPSIVPIPTITGTGATRTLTFTPAANANGSVTVTVTANDGQTALNTTSRTFTITVTPVNDAPTLNIIPNQVVVEDVGLRTVTLTGVGPGGGADEATQTLSFVATSNNPTLVPNPTVSGNTLSYTPAANASGTATITVTLTDSGGTALGGVDAVTRTFSITVNSVNDAPLVDALTAVTRSEDFTAFTVSVTGLGPGGGSDESAQVVTVTATSSSPTVVPNPTVTGSGTSRTLTIAPAANANGAVTITVTVTDSGGTANGGVDTTTRTFTLTVNAVNDAPTFNPIADVTVAEDASAQTVSITGVGAGGGTDESTQTVTLTASSDNPTLVPSPTVTASGGTRTLTFAPVANASGSAIITVTAQDSGGTGNGGVDTTVRTFTINVTSVNDQPQFDVIAAQTVNEDAGLRTVGITGVSAGGGETQTVTFTATSSNQALIPDPTVTGSGTTRTLSYTPAANASGMVTITVTAQDNGGTANGGVDTLVRTFTITVNAVNDEPSFATIGDVTLNEDPGLQNVLLTGLSAGGGEGTQTVTVSASSSNTALVPSVTVTVTGATTRTLSFTPAANTSGTTTITVTAQDNGGTANGGDDTYVQTFVVTVNAVNDEPFFNPLIDFSSPEDTAVNVTLTGISAGPNEGTQTVTFNVSRDNATLVPAFTYTEATRTLNFTPALNSTGTVIFTFTAQDNGGTANGGDDSFTRTVTITIVAGNDAPVNGVPGAQTVAEDGVLTFSAANSNLLSVSDVDAGSGQVRVTLDTLNAGITLASLSGLTLLQGTGTGDKTVIFTGTLTDVNNALAGLTWTPSQHFNGAASLTMTTNDLGNTGGAAQQDSDVIAITVSAVNDNPINTVQASALTSEDTAITFSGGNAVTVADVDSGAGELTVRLEALSGGSITVGDFSQLSQISGNGSADVLIRGTVTDLNDALDTTSFLPPLNQSGAFNIRMTTSDLGNTGSGGVKTDVDTFAVGVTPVNDAPVNTVPGPTGTNPVTPITFTNGFSILDVDAGGAVIEAHFEVNFGTITLGGISGLTFSDGDGIADATMTFQGTIADINTALGTVVYTPDGITTATAVIGFSSDDLGNTPAPAQADSDAVFVVVQ